MKRRNPFKKSFLGIAAGFFIGTKKPSSSSQKARIDLFQTSTQRIGVRFTEKIRSIFRKKWIKIR